MELLATGHICGTFGVDGGLKVESYSGDYRHFSTLKKVYIVFQKNKLVGKRRGDAWFEVEGAKVFFNFALLRLSEVRSLEDAKLFVGADVLVERENASSLGKNEFYACDLCHCSLYFEDVAVARIVNVMSGGSGELLEVEKNGGSICYVPFNNEFIGKVDVEGKKVELKNSWILE